MAHSEREIASAPTSTTPTESRGPKHSWLLFAFLLLVFTAYGMLNSDQGILDKVFELVRYGLSAGLGFEVGRRQYSPR